MSPPALKVMPPTCVSAEIETLVTPDNPKVATFAAAFGTVFGFQLLAVFQSPDPGAASHVALPAKTGAVAQSSSAAMEPASGFHARRRVALQFLRCLRAVRRAVVFMMSGVAGRSVHWLTHETRGQFHAKFAEQFGCAPCPATRCGGKQDVKILHGRAERTIRAQWCRKQERARSARGSPRPPIHPGPSGALRSESLLAVRNPFGHCPAL